MTDRTERALCDAAWDGDIPLMVALLDDAELIARSDVDTALLHASHRGHHVAVELLLRRTSANPNARNAEALWRASQYRRMRVVGVLMPLSDTSGWECWQWAELSQSLRTRLRAQGA